MDLQNRKSPRASWHDYNGGAYFVTICTKNKTAYFGKCTDGMVNFSQIGAWANTCIQQIEKLHKNVFVPVYITMPNHIHMIVLIDENVGLSYNGSQNTDTNRLAQCVSPTDTDSEMQRRSKRCGKLSTIIGQFKSAVTKYAHENGIDFAWQTRFHDHIIRDQNEMNAIADYIETNPLR